MVNRILHFSLVWSIVFVACVLTYAEGTAPSIQQVTFGPSHHFYGYIGHVGNTPWNGNGQYMVVLRTTFQDRMPSADDGAAIVLLDVHNHYRALEIEETRAWNPQQGTMLYWNPDAPDTQFFFNDRDPKTNRIFCVLYDIQAKKRIKEYRFKDTPIGNSGVAQQGGYFLGLNYGRMDRLRKVTGYAKGYDWNANTFAPTDDGIFKVNVNTGKKTLLVSFAQLADYLRPTMPSIDSVPLFINHSLWSRDNQRILFYVRGHWEHPNRVNEFFTMHSDGSHLTRHDTFPGGHPEWGEGHTIIGKIDEKQMVYDVDRQTIVAELGDTSIFPNPGGDIALSHDAQWFVNGYKYQDENRYVVYTMKDRSYFNAPSLKRGVQFEDDVRLDPSPCWRRDGRAIAVPGIDHGGTRQTFVISF